MRLKNFSKGMRQKLGIAIALIKDPPAIIMDEPTSGLDPISASHIQDLIQAAHFERVPDQLRRTSVIVTTTRTC